MNTTQSPRWRDLSPSERAALPDGTRAQVRAAGPSWTKRGPVWVRFSPASPNLTDCAAPSDDAFVQVPASAAEMAAALDDD